MCVCVCVHSVCVCVCVCVCVYTETIRLIRDGEGGMEVGKEGDYIPIIYN